MPIHILSSGPISISSLVSLSALIQPSFLVSEKTLNWNDYNRSSFLVLSTISQSYSAFNADSSLAPYTSSFWSSQYGVISLSAYSTSYRLSATSNTILNNDLKVTVNSVFVENMFSVYMGINGGLSANTLSGFSVLSIPEPAFGSNFKGPVSSIFKLKDLGVKLGDYVDFYIGAGPDPSFSGYFYSQGHLNISFVPVISAIPSPTKFSYYRSQDFDIPSTPLSLSDFHGATNYDLEIDRSWNINNNTPKEYVNYVYQPDGSVYKYNNQVTQLSADGSVFTVSTKHSPITGITTSSNSQISIKNYNSTMKLFIRTNKQVSTENGLPICKQISIPKGTTFLNLSTYLYDLSSYCTFYVPPVSHIDMTIFNYPILFFPNNLIY